MVKFPTQPREHHQLQCRTTGPKSWTMKAMSIVDRVWHNLRGTDFAKDLRKVVGFLQQKHFGRFLQMIFQVRMCVFHSQRPTKWVDDQSKEWYWTFRHNTPYGDSPVWWWHCPRTDPKLSIAHLSSINCHDMSGCCRLWNLYSAFQWWSYLILWYTFTILIMIMFCFFHFLFGKGSFADSTPRFYRWSQSMHRWIPSLLHRIFGGRSGKKRPAIHGGPPHLVSSSPHLCQPFRPF